MIFLSVCYKLYPCSPWYDASDEWLFACSGDATQSEDPWAEFQVDPAVGPGALGLGPPGALPAGVVQPCPKPRALIHKLKQHIIQDDLLVSEWDTLQNTSWVLCTHILTLHLHLFDEDSTGSILQGQQVIGPGGF